MAAEKAPPAKCALSLEVILPGFEPVSILWSGGDSAAFASEQSARWALRKYQRQLAGKGAAALWQGRLYIHRERFAEVLRAGAVEAYADRYASEGANAG